MLLVGIFSSHDSASCSGVSVSLAKHSSWRGEGHTERETDGNIWFSPNIGAATAGAFAALTSILGAALAGVAGVVAAAALFNILGPAGAGMVS